MRKYTYENEEFLYAKGLFYRSLASYEDATPIDRKRLGYCRRQGFRSGKFKPCTNAQ